MSTITLVTGGNRGIGREVCRQLAGRGHNVVLTARSAEAAATAARATGGWVATDMGGPGGRPVEAGAASVVWAATLPDSGPTGGFFRDGKPLPW